MTRLIILAVSGLLALGLGGCEMWKPLSPYGQQLKPLELPADAVNAITGSSLDITTNIAPAVAFANAGDVRERRALVVGYLAQSDWLCDQYMTGVSVSRNSIATGLGIAGDASLVTSLASALPNTAGAWTALSGVATTTRNTLETEVMGGRNLPALLLVLRAARAEDRADLLEKLASASSVEDVDTVRANLMSYHAGCGLNRALAEVSAAAGQTHADAMNRIAGIESGIEEGDTLQEERATSGAGLGAGDEAEPQR